MYVHDHHFQATGYRFRAHRREVEYRQWERSEADGRSHGDADDDVLSLYTGKLPYKVRTNSTNVS